MFAARDLSVSFLFRAGHNWHITAARATSWLRGGPGVAVRSRQTMRARAAPPRVCSSSTRGNAASAISRLVGGVPGGHRKARGTGRRVECFGGSAGGAGSRRGAGGKGLGPGHTVVTVLADGGSRYQSKLFNPGFLRARNLPGWL